VVAGDAQVWKPAASHISSQMETAGGREKPLTEMAKIFKGR